MKRTFPPIASTPPYHSQEIASFGKQPEAATSMLNEELRRIASSNQDLYDKLGKLGNVFSALGIDVDKFDPSKNKGGGSTGIPGLDRLREVIRGPIGGEIGPTGNVTNLPSVFNTTKTGGGGSNSTTTIDDGGVRKIVKDELPLPYPLKLYHSPAGPKYDDNVHTFSVAFDAIPGGVDAIDYSGLVFEKGTSYDTTSLRKLAHYPTSQWNDLSKPLNERRLFPSSWRYATFPALPDLQDYDGSMKLPYMNIDTSYDNFGHAGVVKITNAVSLVANALHNQNWYNTLNGGEIQTLKDTITTNNSTSLWNTLGGYRIPNDGTNGTPGGNGQGTPGGPGNGSPGGSGGNGNPGTPGGNGGNPSGTTPSNPNSYSPQYRDLILYNSGVEYWLEDRTRVTYRDQATKWYNPSRQVYIGHGMTSQWTVGQTNRPYNPAKNDYYAAHHFYIGNWDSPTLYNPAQAQYNLNEDLPNSRGTQRGPFPSGSVMVDMLADDWGHVQFGIWQQLQRLNAGRGLTMQFDTWYDPTKANTIGHPLLNTQHYQDSQKRFSGTPYWYPSDFDTNDSGHLTAVHWSQLPVIQGPQGEAATLTLFVEATNTLPPLTAASVTRTNYGTIYNANYGLTFNIPRGKDGTDGTDGTDGVGTPGAPATVAAVIGSVNPGGPGVSVANIGTTQNAIFRFDFDIPEGVGGTNTYNNYYNMSLQNIGTYNDYRDLVYNPGSNNPTYIKRIAVPYGGELTILDYADTITIGHGIPSLLTVNTDYPYIPYASDDETISIYTGPEDNGDGTWSFPNLNFNRSGHLVNAQKMTVPIGEGGGGGGYTWWVASADEAGIIQQYAEVLTGEFVKFQPALGSPITTNTYFDGVDHVVELGLSGGFGIDLEKLTFGNGLSQDPNTPKTPPFEYDPYEGTTLHVNNNLKDVAGIVRKGSDPYVAGLVTKVWGTDNADNPNWRETVVFRGGQNIDVEFVGVEDGVKVYRINYVPY